MLINIYEWFLSNVIGPIKSDRIKFLLTGRYYNLTPKDRDACKDLMESGNYIWLSRRNTHLTTYLIDFSNFLLKLVNMKKYSFKKGYSHAFFNLSDDILVEAIGSGVVESYFDDVFNCDWICALQVNGLSDSQWSDIGRKLVTDSYRHLGKKYDNFFNIKDSNALSCVELIRVILGETLSQAEYLTLMSDLERIIKANKNLTPQMLRDSTSFKVVLEIKR